MDIDQHRPEQPDGCGGEPQSKQGQIAFDMIADQVFAPGCPQRL